MILQLVPKVHDRVKVMPERSMDNLKAFHARVLNLTSLLLLSLLLYSYATILEIFPVITLKFLRSGSEVFAYTSFTPPWKEVKMGLTN